MTGKKISKTKIDELKDVLEGRRVREAPRPFDKAQDRQSSGQAGGRRQEIKDDGQRSNNELDELTRQITAAEEDAKAHYDKLLRVMADLENFKKRSEREKQEVIKYSNEQLVTDLLPVLDDLDRVLEHLPHGASKELVDFVSGVQMVAKHFVKALNKYGLSEIETEGEKFNPEFHEAVAHLPSDKVKTDHIIEEHRKGYVLNGRVIRAAMVSVSRGRG